MRDCREFIKKYADIENFDVYGNERFIYQYISDKYPEQEVKFDIEKIKLVTLDIEVKSENGFPDVESAAGRNTSYINTRLYNKTNYYLKVGDFNNKQKNVIYKSFSSEFELLNAFINWWMIEDNTPEVITGWNSKLYDIPYVCRRLERVLGGKL